MKRKELQKHIEAYEYLISLGGDFTQDNFIKLAQKFQVSERTIWNWSKNYFWGDKIYARKEKIRQDIEKKTNKEIVNSITNHRKTIADTLRILDTAIKTSLTKTDDGRVKVRFDTDTPKGLSDLARATKDLIALDIQITGKEEGNVNEQPIIEREWTDDDVKKAGNLIDQLNKLRKGD